MAEWRQTTYQDAVSTVRDRAQDVSGAMARPLLSVTADEGVVEQAMSGRRDISAADKSKYLITRPGDVVYNTMRMWQGVSGYCGLAGMVSPAYTVLRPDPSVVDGRFLAHLMKLPENVNLYRRYSQGLVSDTWNLKFSALAGLPLLLPPVDEQHRIAEILDSTDETIRATERIVAKLQCLRVGLMQQIFGSVAWPESQETVELGALLREPPKNGKSPVESAVWTGCFILGLGCLRVDGFAPDQLKLAPSLDASLSSALLEPGDLLISRSNTRERVGFVGRYRDVGAPCIYPDLMMRLRLRPEVDGRFIELALQAGPTRRQIEATASGTSGSMVKITGSLVSSLSVPRLPRSEQARITQLVDEHARLVASELAKLEKLRRVRAGLAADLLAGRARTVAA